MGLAIYKAMIGVMKDIGPIGKNQRNESQKYMFRGIDDLYNAIQPAMVTNGVIHIPTVLESEHYEERRINNYNKESVFTHAIVKVQHTFYAEDGSSVEAITTGEAMDTSDKAFNKAQTASYKYALFHIFNIPTEEEKKNDADADSPGDTSQDMSQGAHRASGNGRTGAQSRKTQSNPSQEQNPQREAQSAPHPVVQETGTPIMASQAELNTIAKLCAATSERKTSAFRESDMYKKFGCQKETCTKETAVKILSWFKKNYPEIEV